MHQIRNIKRFSEEECRDQSLASYLRGILAIVNDFTARKKSGISMEPIDWGFAVGSKQTEHQHYAVDCTVQYSPAGFGIFAGERLAEFDEW